MPPTHQRPVIGNRVLRGLNHIHSLVLFELQRGDTGGFHKSNGFGGSRDDVYAALAYIGKLCSWFEDKNKDKEG